MYDISPGGRRQCWNFGIRRKPRELSMKLCSVDAFTGDLVQLKMRASQMSTLLQAGKIIHYSWY